eukprot:TRINITY_DN13585_c0_g1_i1.p1 TRINITY_DN13585_c0_g1~~TRINITY_DN13585_c0_g1_i1.p1  ORF type:complete len:135 (+),score=43.98 TRINITY_DN13585_c0_g1_i1:71-475(+)
MESPFSSHGGSYWKGKWLQFRGYMTGNELTRLEGIRIAQFRELEDHIQKTRMKIDGASAWRMALFKTFGLLIDAGHYNLAGSFSQQQEQLHEFNTLQQRFDQVRSRVMMDIKDRQLREMREEVDKMIAETRKEK